MHHHGQNLDHSGWVFGRSKRRRSEVVEVVIDDWGTIVVLRRRNRSQSYSWVAFHSDLVLEEGREEGLALGSYWGRNLVVLGLMDGHCRTSIVVQVVGDNQVLGCLGSHHIGFVVVHDHMRLGFH